MDSLAVLFARQQDERLLTCAAMRMSCDPPVETGNDSTISAESIANDMRGLNLENVKVISGAPHPFVYADWLHAESKPTVLCYGGYNALNPATLSGNWFVPDDLERILNSQAFSDRGQIRIVLNAVESFVKTGDHRLPVNLRVIVGQGNDAYQAFERLAQDQPECLKCSVVFNCDSLMCTPEVPALGDGVRGICYAEISAVGSKTDLHSGGYGGVAPNPLEALVRIISKLKNTAGRILIPGFYDRVRQPRKWDLDWRSPRLRQATSEFGGGFTPRGFDDPTLEVHGIAGGYTGNGPKTVIPARALAKLSIGLVPYQSAADILEQFSDYVKSVAPMGVQVGVKCLVLADPVLVDLSNPLVQAAGAALHEVFQEDVLYVPSWGSTAYVSAFERVLNAPSVMMSFGSRVLNNACNGDRELFVNASRRTETIVRWFEIMGR